MDEDTLLKSLARERRVSLAEPRWLERIEARVLHLVSSAHANRWKLVPLRLADGHLLVATSEVEVLDQLPEVSDELGFPLKPMLARRAEVERALARHYPTAKAPDAGASAAPSPAAPPAEGGTGVRDVRRQVAAVRTPVAPRKTPPPVRTSLPTRPLASSTAVPTLSSTRLRPTRLPTEVSRVGRAPLPPRPAPPAEELDGLTRVENLPVDLALDAGPPPGLEDAMAGATEVDARPLLRAPQPSRAANNLNATQPLDPKDVQQAQALARHAEDLNETQPLDVKDLEQARAAARAIMERSRSAAAAPPPAPPPPPTPATVLSVAPASALVDGPPAPGAALAGFHLPPAQLPQGPTPFDDLPPPGKDGAPKPVPPPPAEGERFGKYILLKPIKTGGMAEVFLGKTVGVEGFEKQVAIKRILPHLTESDEFVEMFIDEAKLTVQLNHANIAHIYEFGREAGAYYLVMEYIHGRDVNALFKDAYRRKQPLPVALCCFIVQQLCEGLDYAHRKRSADGRDLCIVHRDISPANILVSFEGAVKIIDFGIAKAVSKISMTRPGLIKGKISYMSPEQMRGQPIDRRSDVFAAGIILYELLASRRLFAAKSDVDTIRNVIKNSIPPLESFRPDAPPDLVAIVMRALEREADRRYGWASELSADLQGFLVRHGLTSPRAELVKHLETFLRQTD